MKPEIITPKDQKNMQTAIESIITPGQLVRKRFVRNKLAIAGMFVLLFMFLASFIGPFLSPYGEYEMFYKLEQLTGIYLLAGEQDVYALNSADGALRWHLTLEKAAAGNLVPAIDGSLYLPFEDGTVLQIDSHDGRVVHTHTGLDALPKSGDAFIALPKVPDNLTLHLEDGYLIAITEDTKIKKWDFTGYSDVVTDPVSDSEGNLYVVCEDGEFFSIRSERGVQRWSFPTYSSGPYQVTEGPLIVRTLDNRAKPSRTHLLGTDRMGLDVLTRLMYGGRISLLVGFVVVIMELSLGVLLGGLAGYYGGWIDNLLMRTVDVFNSIPTLPIILILGSMMISLRVPPQQKIYILMLILGILGWSGVARVVRGQILSLREQEYMVAAEATGLRPMRIIYKHLIPNVMPQLIVIATLGIGGVILLESALSFLGLGLSFPYASWGNMVDAVNDPRILRDHLNIWVPPGVCILLTVMSLNLVGDGLRDAFDPKMKR